MVSGRGQLVAGVCESGVRRGAAVCRAGPNWASVSVVFVSREMKDKRRLTGCVCACVHVRVCVCVSCVHAHTQTHTYARTIH